MTVSNDTISNSDSNTRKPAIAFISSHIHKSLQFEWFQEELKIRNVSHIHIIINTLSEGEPLLATELRKLGITCYVLDYKNNFSLVSNLFKIIKLLKHHQINVVHTTLPFGNLVGQMAGLLAGVSARVTTCENASWAYDYKSRKQWIIDKFTFLSAKKVISVADTANEFLLNKWKIKSTNLVQINHALKFKDYENIDPLRIKALESTLKIEPDDFVIGMISRTEFWKGQTFAIEAMANLVKRYPRMKLLICGSVGVDHKKLIDIIDSYQLHERVKFVGFVNDPIAFLKLIKIQVHVPINKYVENCGISIIEGMAAKTPQLLTLSGYSYQSARHLKNAYVVDYCNAGEIETGLDFLFNNYDRALSFGQQANQDAREQYTIELKYKKHMQVYDSLLNPKKN